MSEQDLPSPSVIGADWQSPGPISIANTSPSDGKKRRGADATIKDQEAVRDYLTFKQTRGLMTDSEKRLLDKIAAVCGMSIEGLQQNSAPGKNCMLKS